MSGLVSYSAYIPYYHLKRSSIQKAWGRGGPGERSVANFDEDALTMAVAAGLDCIRGFSCDEIDGLYFCSTTSPYVENQCATHVLSALGLRQDIITADFTNTLRAGLTGLKTAFDVVDAGKAKQILVIAADTRLGLPSSPEELDFGDGAAAFLVGKINEIAVLKGYYTLADQMQDVWRKATDDFVNVAEGRWTIKEGYVRTMKSVINGLLDKCETKTAAVQAAALGAPTQRSLSALAREVGLDMTSQIIDPLLSRVGNTGTAHPLLVLAAALDKAKRGETILVGGYGDGGDAMLFQTTTTISDMEGRRGLDYYLNSSRELSSYEKYLTFRQLIDRGKQSSFQGVSSPTMMWRDRKWVLGLFASKCNQCGLTTFPVQRICFGCRSKDDYTFVRLADKQAKIFTYSIDMLAGGMDPPIVQTVLEFDDGTRMYCAMTDRDPAAVEIDMPVEMTFRKLHEGAGFNNYFWKCRPLRGEKNDG